MTPRDDSHSTPVDPRLLDRLMACDRALHASPGGEDRSPASSDPELADARGHGRLLLMLSMLDAAETPVDEPGRGALIPLSTWPVSIGPFSGALKCSSNWGPADSDSWSAHTT